MTNHSTIRIWISAMRPKTLAAGFCPIIIGVCLAQALGTLHILSSILCFLTSLLLQVATNFSNDYFDAQKGCDGPQRVGPIRATAAGLIDAQTMKKAMILCFLLAGLSGSYLLFRGGLPFIYLGVAAIISGLLYTGGPLPYGYIGLGDLFVFFFFGPVAVCGTFYLNSLVWSDYVFIASLAPGLLSVAILAVNNLRDIDEDRQNKKRTLAVLLGKTFIKIEYTFCVITACIIPVLLFFWRPDFIYSLLSIIVLPLAKGPLDMVWKKEGPILNEALSRTAKCLISYTILYAMSLFL